jgi:hypothetical protein
MMQARTKLIALSLFALSVVSLAACAVWPFTSGPKDLKVISVTDVNFKDEPQLQWTDLKPRPSIIISRIDFSTRMDLLTLARRKEYNVVFDVGLCSNAGVQNPVGPYGGVYVGELRINPSTKETPDYAAVMAKGPPFIYQVYVEKINSSQGNLCFALAGGNMLGGRLVSNVATIPPGH